VHIEQAETDTKLSNMSAIVSRTAYIGVFAAPLQPSQ